jgi:hypothetical protein
MLVSLRLDGMLDERAAVVNGATASAANPVEGSRWLGLACARTGRRDFVPAADQGIGDEALEQLAKRDLSRLLAADATRRERLLNRTRAGGTDPGGSSFWVCIPDTNDEVHLTRRLPLSQYEIQLLHPYGKFLEGLARTPSDVAEVAQEDAVLRALASQIGGTAEIAVTKRPRQ